MFFFSFKASEKEMCKPLNTMKYYYANLLSVSIHMDVFVRSLTQSHISHTNNLNENHRVVDSQFAKTMGKCVQNGFSSTCLNELIFEKPIMSQTQRKKNESYCEKCPHKIEQGKNAGASRRRPSCFATFAIFL